MQPVASRSAGRRRNPPRRQKSPFLWALPFVAAMLPVALLSVVTYRIASQSVEALVDANNLAEASDVSDLVSRDVSSILEVAQGVAALPGTLEAAKTLDDALQTRLKAVVYAYPQIERAFVTDSQGLLWTDYPSVEGGYGVSLADEEWFRDASLRGKPTVSGVAVSRLRSQTPVVEIAVPIAAENAKPAGYLVLEYGLKQTGRSLQSGKLQGDGYAYVLDQHGVLAGHPLLSLQGALKRQYAMIDPVREAMASGKIVKGTYVDPVSGKEMAAVFMPFVVGRNTWLSVAQQSVAQAYEPLTRVRANIFVAGLLLSVLSAVFVVALARSSARIERLNRELDGKNQQLREVASIVGSSNDAIVALTLKGAVKTWNAAAESMYGFAAADMLGKPIFGIVPEAEQGTMRRLLKRLHHGAKVKNVETAHRRKDGSLVPVSVTLSPVRDEDGAVVGASAIVRDITERKQVDQMKSDFISIVSHQLKAPITAMSWTIELLLDGTFGQLDAEIRKPISEMQDIVRQNYALVTDILNVSRIDRGVIEVKLAPAKLSEVLEQAVRAYRPTFIQKKLELRVENAPEDLVVWADRDKLAEAIGNSVSNALKHTETGSITVRSRRGDKPGTAVIEVIDTGKGMSPEILKKLFSRDQVLSSNASPESSAGLGLYITRNFMRLQKGDVRAASEPGKGSTFTYTIPLAVAGNDQIPHPKDQK